MHAQRHFKPGQFIRETIGPTLSGVRADARSVVLGIDECVNSAEWISPMTLRLMEQGYVTEVTPLWYSTRPFAEPQPDGAPQSISTLGAFDRASAAERREAFIAFGLPALGRHVRGEAASWPDEGIVSMLVCAFLRSERLCLLTGNAAQDADGLYKILHDEVKPAIESVEPMRLGLTVLVRHPDSKLPEYAGRVEAWFGANKVQPGFSWIIV